MKWPVRVLVAFDQFWNAIFDGNPDETISSRVGRQAIKGKLWALVLEKAIDAIFRLVTGERGHCRASIEWDEV